MSPVQLHVTPSHDQWQLSRDGSQVAIFEDQFEALEAACDRAERERPSNVVVGDATTQTVEPESVTRTETAPAVGTTGSL